MITRRRFQQRMSPEERLLEEIALLREQAKTVMRTIASRNEALRLHVDSLLGPGDDAETLAAIKGLDHAPSRIALEAERGLMLRLGGGCALPLGALATVNDDGSVSMVSIVAEPDGLQVVRSEVSASGPEETAEAAEADLLAKGAGPILEALR